MEIILKQDVKNLGYKDDIVKVRDGYGRNYLIPNKMAVIASESAKKQLQEELRQRAHKLAKLLADAQELAQKLEAVQVKVEAKANENGAIFGSVTTAQLAEALEKAGVVVDRKVITIPEAPKALGEFTAEARLHKEVKATIHFEVVAAE
ncbi:MAG: 50S ribosomal protein L9 [Paludibacteraceae bacterium]|nr:50S ribosomal protein L9 [Paludibacteraceae bacterium]